MKTYGRVIVVLLGGAIALLGPSALGQNLFETDELSGNIHEFVSNNGVLSTNPTLFASGLSGPLGLAFYPIPATMPATQLTVTKLQATVNFNPAKSDIDTCSLTATLGLESSFNVSNQPVTVNVGQAQASFTLNAKGRGVTSADTCKLSYTRKTKLWTLTASMKKGSWATDWAQYGVTNATTAKTGVTVTLPVTVVTSNQTFFTEKTLNYKATADKSGTLK